MNREAKIQPAVQHFRLPRYQELPTVELYLDQTTELLNEHLAILGDVKITSSMISNYVKHHLIRRPIKKRYGADQIAELFFIAVAKNVMSLNDLKAALKIQRASYATATAYDYFAEELENVLAYVFGLKANLATIGEEQSEYKHMLRNIIKAVAYKTYIDRYFAAVEPADEL
ncbi:DUF1836 domain-containing protein [Limosilactobacillus ingluviei]|uniref:DUF1836 domain-containing protein n=1 Tax=Limosilactobacillus ingluviei TaxID=148604 RepID=UPI00195D9B16|nr:DUF1836 domain-containing protein [Limosilactobacillus ingluviei]MBM6727933.1 DUF1836 domain-containing protein [Limosilactobacillus ingluviei]